MVGGLKMANKRIAGAAARRKSRAVYKQNRKKSKRQILKKFANFVGKVTYKTARKMRKSRRMGRRTKFRSYRKRRY